MYQHIGGSCYVFVHICTNRPFGVALLILLKRKCMLAYHYVILTPCILGKKNKQITQMLYFFIFVLENLLSYFMQIVCKENNLHEMWKLIFREKVEHVMNLFARCIPKESVKVKPMGAPRPLHPQQPGRPEHYNVLIIRPPLLLTV